MAIALVIPLLLGVLLHRRITARSAWYDLLGGAIAVAVLSLLMGVNCGLRAGLSMGWAAGLTAALLAVACPPLFRTPNAREAAPRAAPWVQLLLIVLLALSVYRVQLQRQHLLEADFALGSTTQGLLLSDQSRIALSSGADLSVVIWAELGGTDVFSAQGDLSALAVVGTLLLLFSVAQRCCGSYRAALLTTALCAFGLGDPLGLGLLEVSSPRHWLGLLAFAALLSAAVLMQERPSTPRALLLAGALAASTTFSPTFLPPALLLLPFLGLAAARLAATPLRSALPLWGLACAVALAVAATQTDPSVLLAAAEAPRRLPQVSDLSWVVLSSPLWLWLLLRAKSPATVGGALFLLTGALLVTTPAQGSPLPPESLPWAAVLDATALWLMGLALSGPAARLRWAGVHLGALRGGRLELTRAGAGAALALLALTAAVVHQSDALARARSERPQPPPLEAETLAGLSRGQRWLARHPQLLLDPIDLEASSWLRVRRSPGARVLLSPSDDPLSEELFVSTFTGSTGMASIAGESPAAAALSRRFWLQPDPETLAILDPDWLYYRSDEGLEPSAFPAATLARRLRTEERLRLLYPIDRARLAEPPSPSQESQEPQESQQSSEPPPPPPVSTIPRPDLQVRLLALQPRSAAAAPPNTILEAQLEFSFAAPPTGAVEVVGVWRFDSSSGERSSPPFRFPLEAGSSRLPLLTPETPDRYRLSLCLERSNGAESAPGSPLILEVGSLVVAAPGSQP